MTKYIIVKEFQKKEAAKELPVGSVIDVYNWEVQGNGYSRKWRFDSESIKHLRKLE